MGNNGSKTKNPKIEILSNRRSKSRKTNVQNTNRFFSNEYESATTCNFYENEYDSFDQFRQNLEKSNAEIGDCMPYSVEVYANANDDNNLAEKKQEEKKSFGTMTDDDMLFSVAVPADDEEIPENLSSDSIGYYKRKMKSMQRVIEELQAQLVETKMKAETEKELIRRENKSRETLLEAKYNEDKKDLKKMWEQKLIYMSSKLIDDHSQEMTTFKNKCNQEKCNLEEQLDTVVAEFSKFKEKYNILKATYEELRLHTEDMSIFID